MMKHKLVSFLFFLLLSAYSYGQVTVKGTIIDKKTGESLPGVSIIQKGTSKGTVTNFDGNFSLSNLPSDAILQVSFVGYTMLDVPVNGQQSITIKLEQNLYSLDEVIAVGYGVQKKSVITGAISSLNSEELLQSRPANINNALSGRVSGVTVLGGSAQPGSSPKVVIRGLGTNGNSNPLYIVDGLPLDDMNAVNPADIESVEVLKDATSTAIYGARAANGVILVTTKKGQRGKTTLAYDGFYGTQKVANTPDMLGTGDYLTLMKEFYANDGTAYPESMPSENKGIDTDWIDAITDIAPVQEHNLTVTSGGEKGTSLFSLNYRDQDGVIGGDKSFFKRYGIRYNGSYEVKKYLRIGANMNFSYIDRMGVGEGTNGWNPMYYAILMDPTTPLYDENSTDNFGYGTSTVPFTRMWNPLAFLEISSNGDNKTQNFYGNTYFELEPVKNLVFRSDFAVNLKNNHQRSYTPKYTHRPGIEGTESVVSQQSTNNEFWQWENTLRYKLKLNEHNFSFLGGMTASETSRVWQKGGRKKLVSEAVGNEDYWYLNAGDVSTVSNSGEADVTSSLYSLFGRVSYNYQEKYMIEGVIRRDGSSNFGPENKYAIFPAFSLGWNVTNEDWWKCETIEHMKFRFSFGQNGNEKIGAHNYTSIIKNDAYHAFGPNRTIYTGSAPDHLVNKDVIWETSEQLNIGTDIVFSGGLVRATVDYFDKSTKDLLLKPTLEAVRGNESPYYNSGDVCNKGIEVSATYAPTIGEVKLNISGNVSYVKNEVTKMDNNKGFKEGGNWRTSTNITRMEVGQPIGYFYGYKTNGIFQNQSDIDNYINSKGEHINQPKAVPGDFKWADTNNDGEITPDDRTNLGNPWPKWVFGLNLGAKYKGFDFTCFINGRADVDIWSAQYRTEGYGRANLPSYFMDRWHGEGTSNTNPRLTVNDPNGNYSKASDYFLYDGSYVKIGSLELGYTLSSHVLSRVDLSKVRFYVAMDNVATFSDYPYFDPEVGSMDGDVLNTGLDYSIYPQARTTRVGVSVAF